MFDAKQKTDELIENIKDFFNKNGSEKSAVIGISGGKDSTITAALLVRALGKDRVVGVMMPNGIQPDIEDSKKVIETLDIKGITVNINSAFTDICNKLSSASITPSSDAKVNLQPRLRMSVLYAVAQSLPEGGFVINTCNRSEDYVGYSTKYGDAAGDISVLGNLLVSEILQIGDFLEELPKELIYKAPSDGLWSDTDEDRFGFTYSELEQYIKTGTTLDPDKDKRIKQMHDTSRHKYNKMYTC